MDERRRLKKDKVKTLDIFGVSEGYIIVAMAVVSVISFFSS